MATTESALSKFSGCCSTATVADNTSNDGDSTVSGNDTQTNNNTIFPNDTEQAYSFPRRQQVDVTFKDLRYTVRIIKPSKFRIERKEILHGVDGSFKSGQLTAIMGPSGAGKTTLLNILAGYVASGVSGTVEVNGKCRSSNSESFRALSAYIHQDDAMRPWLTVNEVMTCAAHLKLGFGVSASYKQNLIRKILFLLGLDKRTNTLNGRLSGGQKKRLAIALEMISNPPILFLDEPTTGLDSSSCTQCICLLKRLAQQGRTVICTIHQPSALVFEMFDNLYAVAGGNCIYQGPVRELVPYLSTLGLQCPSYHNPADFLMEVASGEYNADLKRMGYSSKAKYYNSKALNIGSGEAIYPSDIELRLLKHQLATAATIDGKVYEFNGTGDDGDCGVIANSGGTDVDRSGVADVLTTAITTSAYSSAKPASPNIGTPAGGGDGIDSSAKGEQASLLMQFLLLYHRNLLCAKRNYFLLWARIITHVLIGGLFGYLYTQVGGKATTTLANYVYVYGSNLLVVYTGKMAVMMSFPVEMEMLAREHFNRWYKLGPYFFSVICYEIPFQVFCAVLYVTISYFLTGNYYADNRFYIFLSISILTTLCAQAWGFFVGATLPVKLAVFIGPVLAVLFSVFGFCTGYMDITPVLRWMWYISYFRAGFHNALIAIYGWDRPDLECPQSTMYCHFKNPQIFLNEMKVINVDVQQNVMLMVSIFTLMHVLTVFVLWYRLNKR